MLHFRMDMPLSLMSLYGSVIIVVVILFRKIFKNKLPKAVFPLLWTMALIRLLIPFSISSPFSVPVPDISLYQEGNETAVAEATEVSPGTYVPGDTLTDVTYTEGLSTGVAQTSVSHYYLHFNNLSDILTIIFCIGMAATTAILFRQKIKYSSKLKDSLLIEHNETINEILRDRSFGHVLVFSNDYIATPLVAGILNPRIYLPASMEFKNVQLLSHVLSHETMHIKRKDNLTKAVILLVLCLHWYNPLVWIMSKYLSADIEAACDASLLKNSGIEERKSYAYSLLSMAITGNRQTLLYSAFSKTEVEKRIENVLRYKKPTAFVLILSILLVFCSLSVSATGGQAPFSNYLSSYCSSSNSKWAVKVTLNRDISLGDNPQTRADNIILSTLRTAKTQDPEVLQQKIITALAKEFGVEKRAFHLTLTLNLDDDVIKAEYSNLGIGVDKNGFYVYKDEPVRIFRDQMLGALQTQSEGTVDINILRNRLGEITSVVVWHQGDSEFDNQRDGYHYSTQLLP